MLKLAICAQIVIALSVTFVWIIRLSNVQSEFREYGLPDLVRDSVGAAKIALATLLIVGIWYPPPVLFAALVMAFLMLSAQVFHFRAKHPWPKYVPSFVLLLLSLFVSAVYSGKVPA